MLPRHECEGLHVYGNQATRTPDEQARLAARLLAFPASLVAKAVLQWRALEPLTYTFDSLP